MMVLLPPCPVLRPPTGATAAGRLRPPSSVPSIMSFRIPSLARPGGLLETFGYDLDGRMNSNVIHNGSSSPHKYHQSMLRDMSFAYDARGKLLVTRSGVGFQDSLTAAYTGLGHLASGSMVTTARVNGVDDIEYRTYDGLSPGWWTPH